MLSSTNTEECEALNLAALPYLGYYGSEQYDLILPCMIIQNNDFWKDESEQYLPLWMLNDIKKAKLSDLELQNGNVYAITYDARVYFNSDALYHRMNFVPHPLVFKDLKVIQDDKRSFRASFYPSSEFNCSIAECLNEPDGMKFEPQDFEVYVHDEIFMSPNNCAFNYSYLRPVLSFGCLVNRIDFSDIDKPRKVLDVYWFTVLNHNSIDLYDPWLRQWDTNTNELRFKEGNSQKHYLELLKNSLRAVDKICEDLTSRFVRFFQSEIDLVGVVEEYELECVDIAKFLQQALIEEKKKSDTILSEFYNYVWLRLGKPSLSDFGKSFFEGVDHVLKLRLFAGYIIQIIQSYYDTLYYNAAVMLSPSNTLLLEEIRKKRDQYTVKSKEGEETPFEKFRELINELHKVPSRDIRMIQDLIKLFSANEEKEGYIKLSSCRAIWQSYIYERTWVFLGRMNDIHADFGRVSFCCSPEIDASYHLNNEYKVELLKKILETLTEL